MKHMSTPEEIYAWAREVVDELAGASFEPFTEGWEAGKVAGKWFMLTKVVRGERLINVKATPEEVRILQLAYPEVRPGFHMNKKHWVTVTAGENITRGVLEELITESYLLVVAKLPKAARPFGWHLHDPNQRQSLERS